MTAQPDPQNVFPGEEAPKKSNLWVYACGSCGGCGCLMVALVVGGLLYLSSWVEDSLAAKDPLPAATFSPTEEQRAEAKTLLEKKQAAYEDGETVQLSLTSTQLNTLGRILQDRNGKIQVLDASIQDDHMDLRLSVAYEVEGETRYFNLVMEGGRVTYSPTTLKLSADRMQVGEKDWTTFVKPGEAFAEGFVRGALAPHLQKIRTQHGIDLQEVHIRDGKLHIRLRKSGTPAPAADSGGAGAGN